MNPANVSVDITGLSSGQLYNVQLLFSENGSAADRHWDIGVDGNLLVDDFNTNGTSVTLGRVYSGVFDPGADGALNFLLGVNPYPGDPNNTPPLGLDNNPILHGVVVHTVIPEPGSAAQAWQARPARAAKLPRDWTWERPAIRFDAMFRNPR